MIPKSLWGLPLRNSALFAEQRDSAASEFHLHPHYRSERPLDATLAQVQPGRDEFISEKYADQISAILDEWSANLLHLPNGVTAISRRLAANFVGTAFAPVQSRIVRSSLGLEVRRNTFAVDGTLNRDQFVSKLQSTLKTFSKIIRAEFQLIAIQAENDPSLLRTRIRYEIVGAGADFYREQRVGEWELVWRGSSPTDFAVRSWKVLGETQARSHSPFYVDIAGAVLGGNASYATQLLHGTDYWRTVLDGACGIDIYGHNGVSAADIDNDGFDDLYVCQPAGLPNRLYRNRGDGTFEDITESSGLGILENTACALFADFSNSGRQDVIVVCANGPLLFLNQGNAKFRERPDAFQFANPPQGTFTGAAVADYDRDGWLDIYFCLYSYYQGTGQYRYPLPYHAAENGPSNFLMRNNRDGTFRDVTAESGLNQNNTRYSFCCAWNDYNHDGWPDLYVVNDFGRKNLYLNNGDGTFTDIAAQAGAEDIGAGMSVAWADFDNDGAEDIYVGNMWTAAGLRVSAQSEFKPNSSKEVRSLYQKHAMGNSLLHNRGQSFDDVTTSAGVAVGRWAWSSDSFDFDHDGFPDLYVVNGMVSGPTRPNATNDDLNSFFWRQVVARSPDDMRGSPEYERGWNAINELIRSDKTWSGYERNVFYANNRDGTFSDVSAAVGLDFVEDGRAFALADFDHDGRLEIFVKNRNAPVLRVMKNVVEGLPASIAFRLQGIKSNRDAIGAVVTIETSTGRQSRTLQAGSGFLSQHSKDVFFGLGDAEGLVRASIQWPSGLVQKLPDLPANRRIWIVEGLEPSRIEVLASVAGSGVAHSSGAQTEAEVLPVRSETWLLEPYPAPDFSLQDFSGQTRTLSELRGKKVLLHLWSDEASALAANMKSLQDASMRWASHKLQSIVVLIAGMGEHPSVAFQQKPSYLVLRGTDDFAAVYNIVYRQLFDRHRDLTLPVSFLIEGKGDIVKVYQGAIDYEHVDFDFQHIPQTDPERLAKALPFPNGATKLNYGRNYLSYGALFFQRGYLDQAEVAFQRALQSDASSAEALYGIGSVYLNQNKNAEARDTFQRAVKLKANYPDTLPDSWNNLGVIATREGRITDAVENFQQALRLNPDHLLSLDNLGNAYRLQKLWDDAREVLEHALEVAPNDPEANYSLGMVYAQADDTAKAYEYLQRALKARPAYPEALNNLGILYLRTERRDQAIASFEECIRVAPAFDQAYLNLARVYAIEGARDKARNILDELLKQHPGHAQAKAMLEQLDVTPR
jgi:tetratricopeptide (TPR) repeat protein